MNINLTSPDLLVVRLSLWEMVIELKPSARYDPLGLGVADAVAEAERVNEWLARGETGNG
jgi:hypothetical protein